MKLVLKMFSTGACTYDRNDFVVFECASKEEAEYALLEAQEYNKDRDSRYKEAHEEWVAELDRITQKSLKTGKTRDQYLRKIPKAPSPGPVKCFCHQEVYPDTEYQSFEILTLEEWVNKNSVKEMITWKEDRL
jgi:hypothetical protein